MTDHPRGPTSSGSPTSADVDPADADFLFHLYRGSELLRDNKVGEAKDEIESALRLQPRDSQGQDMLARVYFRLGVYPRAIAIYEAMAADFADEVSPHVNLALCYLKTGQPDLARSHLETAVTLDPLRTRAWGYLGLAFERLGDLHKAKAAFERGGHHAMARRIDDRITEHQQVRGDEPPPSSTTPVQMAEVRRVAEEAFHELDMSDMAFSLDDGLSPSAPADASSWRVKVGHAEQEQAAPVPAHGPRAAASLDPGSSPSDGEEVPRASTPLASELVREAAIVFPRPGRVSKRPDGSVVIGVEGSVACRLDLVRVMSTTAGTATAEIVHRRGRGELDQPVGDPIRPLYLVQGALHVVLCTTRERVLTTIDLRDDVVVVREESVAMFDPRLELEGGRLPSGHGDTAPMLQLRGTGSLVLETRSSLSALELRAAQGCMIRGASLVGWVGRPSVRNVPLSEAPAGARGWLSFSGDGWLLVDASPSTEFGA